MQTQEERLTKSNQVFTPGVYKVLSRNPGSFVNISFTKPSEKWPCTSLSCSEGPLHIPQSKCKTKDNNARSRTPEFPPFNLVSGSVPSMMLLPPWCLCLFKFLQGNRNRKKSFFLPSFFVPSFLLLFHIHSSKWSLSWGIGSAWSVMEAGEDPRSCYLQAGDPAKLVK